MPRTCPICNFNFDKYGSSPGSDVHRCLNGKVTGSRKPTRLEQEQIAKGLLDPASLISQPAASSQPAGRLAPRHAATPQARQPQANAASSKGQPTLAELMAAITKLTLAFEKLQATLTERRAVAKPLTAPPCTDAQKKPPSRIGDC